MIKGSHIKFILRDLLKHVAILIHKKMRYEEHDTLKDSEGRLVATKGNLNGRVVTLVSLYAPNEGQITFLNDSFRKLTSFAEGSLFCAGDFNYIVDLSMDRTYPGRQSYPSSAPIYTKLKSLLEDFNLVDCWRLANRKEKDYSFYSARHGTHTRIDLILTFQQDAPKIRTSTIGVKTLSDHAWVEGEFQFGEQHPRTRYWNLNKACLWSDLAKEEILKALRTYLRENDTGDCTDAIVWDALKSTIRGDIISISTALKKDKESKVAKLMDSIAALEAQYKRSGCKKIYHRLIQERECLKSVETTAIEHNLLYLNQLSWQNSPRSQKMLAWRVRKKEGGKDNSLYH